MAKVLIVDDSPMQIKILRKMLEKLGHSVIEAGNGAEGIEVAESQLPDLILLDVVMPDVNGFDVTRKLRKQDNTKNIPIVLVSSKSQETDKHWGRRQGANGYLVKPFNKQEFMDAAGQFLDKETKVRPADIA